MNCHKRTSILTYFIICSFFSLIVVELATAQFRLPFRKKDSTNSEGNFELSIKNGPWLVMCTSFTGENAEQKARMLAFELQRHRLKPYLYRQTFDYSQTTTGLGWQKPNSVIAMATEAGELNGIEIERLDDLKPKPRRMRSANLTTVNEVAVLVGDYASIDDNKAQKVLAKIKALEISSMQENSGQGAENSLMNSAFKNLEKSKGGPLRTAILVPNPLLPDEYFDQNPVDDFVIKLNKNKNIEYSLLDCPGLYSVKVASFRGLSTIDPEKIKSGVTELQSLHRTGQSLISSQLIEAEEKAHKITQILRNKGIEAYEFHDRHESYVCIGSFDWVTRESNNTIMNNPEIVRLVNRCTPEVRNLPGIPNAIIPKSINGIALDPEPTPILVPKIKDSFRTSGRLSFRR